MKNPVMRVRSNESIAKASAMIKALAEEFHCHYMDVNDGLKDEHGNLKLEYTVDGIHMDAEAY